MIRRTTLLVCAVVVAAGLGYAAVSAQSKPAAGSPTVSVFKTPT
jgi:hypothetical protein